MFNADVGRQINNRVNNIIIVFDLTAGGINGQTYPTESMVQLAKELSNNLSSNDEPIMKLGGDKHSQRLDGEGALRFHFCWEDRSPISHFIVFLTNALGP